MLKGAVSRIRKRVSDTAARRRGKGDDEAMARKAAGAKATTSKSTAKSATATKKAAPATAAPAKKSAAAKKTAAAKVAKATTKKPQPAKKAAQKESKVPKSAAAKKAAPLKKAAAKSAPAKATKPAPKKAAPAKATKQTPAPAAKKAPAAAKAQKAAPAKSAPEPSTAKAAAPKKAAVSAPGPVNMASAPAPAPAKAAPKPVKAHDEKFLESQRVLLLAEREEYEKSLQSFLDEADQLAADMEPGDTQFDDESGEGDPLGMERERDLAMAGQARSAIEEIDRALAKIGTGTYGICENCQQPIMKERLKALPFASLCVACKSGGITARRTVM